MNIALIVFSGTGNTLHVSKLLGNALENLQANVTIITLGLKQHEREEAQIFREQIATYHRIGFAFPVLGFGAPANVLAFAHTLPEGHNQVFIFKSAADNHQINNAASEELEEILTHKGYDVFHDFLYIMPCNFMVSYPKAFNLQIIDEVKRKATLHALELVQAKRSKLLISTGWHLIARTIHYLESHYGRQRFGTALNATSKCTLCLTCLKNCPIQNITCEGSVLTFHNNCLFCMRCVYSCPTQSIDSKSYHWCVIKEGYNLKEYLNAHDENRVFITQQSRGFWRHFRDYFFS
jgi:ferredoxin